MSIFYGSRAGETETGSGGTEPASSPSLALYLAGLLVQIAGLAAVGFQIGEQMFFVFTIALSLIGAGSSFFLRQQQIAPRFLRFAVVLLVAIIFLYVVRGDGVLGTILPVGIQNGIQETLLVTTLAFCATFATFLWVNDEAVVFSCVWAIAMIGLTGTINVNQELIVCFVVFLAGAVFLLIHQNTLGPRRDKVKSLASPFVAERSRGILSAQLLAAAFVWGGALALGFVVAIPVQMVGKNLSLAAVIQRLKVSPSPTIRNGNRPKLVFDNLQSFSVGLGPVDDDPTERLFVLSDGPHYWRGRTFDQYNGHGWGTSLAITGVELMPTSPQADRNNAFTFQVQPFGAPRRSTRRLIHRFHVTMSGAGGPLYHAAEPRQAHVGAATVYERQDNTIGVGRLFGDEYEITSEVSDPRPSELRSASTKYPEDIRLVYLLQGTSNEGLAALVKEALADVPAQNSYDKAQAIRRFVAHRCVYTREARAVPQGRDAVDFFLNDSREGYCDLYATSVAVLCRYAGIPARVATGFAPGTEAPAESLTDHNLNVPRGDKRRWYLLRGSDLHSWCEVYFVGYGWIAFDATQDTAAAITPPPETPQPKTKPTGLRALFERGGIPLLLISLGILGICYVALSELWSRFNFRSGSRGGRASRARLDALTKLYRDTARRMGRRGPRLTPSTTPQEFVALVRNQIGDAVADALLPLVRAIEIASYSPEELTADEIRAARRTPRRVHTALKQSRAQKSRTTAGDVA